MNKRICLSWNGRSPRRKPSPGGESLDEGGRSPAFEKRRINGPSRVPYPASSISNPASRMLTHNHLCPHTPTPEIAKKADNPSSTKFHQVPATPRSIVNPCRKSPRWSSNCAIASGARSLQRRFWKAAPLIRRLITAGAQFPRNAKNPRKNAKIQVDPTPSKTGKYAVVAEPRGSVLEYALEH